MYPIKKSLVVFLLPWAFFFLMGCSSTRLILESESSQKPSPSYRKGGPPPWAPAHGYRAKHHYRYYPSSRVYHDRDRGVYFCYKDGQWKMSVSLPSSIRVDLNNYVSLAMNTSKPYEWDHEVTKRYPPGQMKKKPQKKHKNK